LTLVCSMVLPEPLTAQNRQFDSLLLALKTARHDTVRIKTYANLTDVCELDEILTYAKPGIAICEKAIAAKKTPAGVYLLYYGGLLNNVGYYYSKHGDVPKSLEYYQKAAGILEKTNNKKEAAILLNNIAYIYQNQGDVNRALEYYFKNLRVQEEIKDDKGMAYTLSNIGYTYDIQGDQARAEEYYDKAITFCEKTGDKSCLAIVIINKGLLYKKKNLGRALEYYKKGLAVYEEINDAHGISYALNNLGSIYSNMGKNDTALVYCYKSLAIVEKNGYKDLLSSNCITIARILLKEGNYAEAKTYALRGLDLAKKRGSPIDIRAVAFVLKEIYKKQNNFKEALSTYELEMQMQDSMVNESNQKQFLKKQLEYDYEKKELQSKVKQEQRLSVLKLDNEKKHTRKNMILYGLIFLALGLGVSMFFLYKFFQQKNIINANRNNELKQKLLLSQMNPHFIFNSVDNIQSLILQKQDEEAVSYLGKFSKLTRQILENSVQNYISLQEELTMTENYLSIQRLLYNNKFNFHISVDDAIDAEQVLLPPMLTQPFIENAIKHGMKHKDKDGEIDVRFFMKGHSLFFEVTDNGLGLEAKEQASEHRSMAIDIVAERLKHHAGKKEMTIHVDNRMENNVVTGVRSTFEIPYMYEN
jgi:tetratricopeptide (TPR) repeat protein